jgi:hypothetical protein
VTISIHAAVRCHKRSNRKANLIEKCSVEILSNKK